MRLKRLVLTLMAVTAVAFAIVPGAVSAHPRHQRNQRDSRHGGTASVPRYRHIVEIMMENTNYGTIIGNPSAPNINALANKYGLATNYFGVTHPSEPNYVANLGGTFFGIQDDNQFYCTPALATTDPMCAGTTVNHTVNAQPRRPVDRHGKSWKGYFQNLPVRRPGVVISSAPTRTARTVQMAEQHRRPLRVEAQPVHQLRRHPAPCPRWSPTTSWASTCSPTTSNYSLVVPDQCNDMHGTGGCSDTDALIKPATTTSARRSTRSCPRGPGARATTRSS